MDRRTFMKISAGSIFGGLLLSCAENKAGENEAMGNPERQLAKIGFQLYSIRFLLEKDFQGILSTVAKAGYKELEFHDYFGNTPADVRKMIDDLGVTSPSVHVSIDRLRNNLSEEIENAATMGQKFMVCPWLSEDQRTADGYKALIASLNEAGEACQKAGIQLAYHNHDFEFFPLEDGALPMDLILAQTDADKVKIELDLYWIRKAGHDALAYFEKHPGRFPLCHVKDMDAEGNMVDVGAGVIDFAEIFAKSEQAGLKHYIAEYDNPEDPVATVKNCYNYLEKLRF